MVGGSFSNYQNPTHAAGTMGVAIVQDTEYSKSFQVGLLYDVLEISKPINREVGPRGHVNRHDD
jgi:hypothetical protein